MDKNLTQGNGAIFIQLGGSDPANKPRVGGIEGQMVALDALTLAAGDITPVFARDPRNYKNFIAVADTVAPPDDFDSGTIMFREEKSGNLPRILLRQECGDDIYVHYGECLDPTNFLSGWNAYALVIAGARRAGSIEHGGLAFDSDEIIQDQYSFKALRGIFGIGGIVLKATAETREIVDITYGRRGAGCTNCAGIPEVNDIYALMKGDGAAVPASVRYSTDGGATWTSLAITGIGNTEAPVAIEVVGDNLVVVSPTASSATTSGYYVIPLDRDTGAPVAGATWTKVTAGFTANFKATDAVVSESGMLYIGAEDSTIYKADGSQLGAGVTTANQGAVGLDDIVRLASAGSVTAATTAGGDVLLNRADGPIWSAVEAAVGAGAGAVGVVDHAIVWAVDSATNTLRYTKNGGKTWSTITLPLVATAIQDIVVVNQNVIHVALTNGGQGYIATTWNGGYSWTIADPRLVNLPVNDRINRLAVPSLGSDTIRANHLVGAALDGAGTGGEIIIGAAPIR